MKHAARRNDFLVPLVTPVALWIAFGSFGCQANPIPVPGCTAETSDAWESMDPTRNTVDSLIAFYLPHVYSNADSAGYDSMLHDRYSFQRLSEDPDTPENELFWDKTEELRIGGKMFRGTPNDENQSVESITLNIHTGTISPSSDTDQPDDEEWFDVTSIVDLTVVVNNPDNTDDPITNFLIDSDQIFVVSGDPDSAGLWVVVKQEDRARIN